MTKKENNGLIGCLVIILSPILLPLAILLLGIGLALAVCGIIPLITFCIVGLLLGLENFNNIKERSGNFWTHSLFMSGILALLPAIVCFTITSELTVASSSDALACFMVTSGSIYAINTCLVLFLIKIINKFFVSFAEKLQWILAYIITISQVTIAGFILKSADTQGNFSDEHIYLATIPILVVSLLVVILIALCKFKVKNSTASLYLQADELCKQGKYDDAIKIYKKAHSLNGDKNGNAYYHYAMTICYMKQGDYTQMFIHNEKALEECSFELRESLVDECIDKFIIEKDYDDEQVIDQFTFKTYHKNLEDVSDNIYEYLMAKQSQKDEMNDEAIKFYSMIDKSSIFYKNAQKAIKEIKQLPEKYYDSALKAFEEQAYVEALRLIDNALSIETDNKKYVELKDEIAKGINCKYIVEKDFQDALQAYNNKDYALAINKLERVIKLIPDNAEYQSKLQNIQDEYREILPKAENFYKNADKYSRNDDFESAIAEIDKALELIKDNKYVKLKNYIKNRQLKFQDEQKAEELYLEAQSLYSSDNTDFNKVLDLLNKATTLSPKKTYEDMLTKVKRERDLITAEKLYEEAKGYFNNKDYNSGLSSIKQAVKLDPSNRMYIDLKQKIDWEQKEAENREKADKCFKEGLQALQDGDFEDAIEYLEEVLNLQPHNEDCKTLLDKARTGKIDITSCTKNALLTLDFINTEQAENIIQARNNGEMWYDYQKFAEQFNILPHQWVEVEEKIEFPLKQANKYGRTLDW